jgi:hypothetical protein
LHHAGAPVRGPSIARRGGGRQGALDSSRGRRVSNDTSDAIDANSREAGGNQPQPVVTTN